LRHLRDLGDDCKDAYVVTPLQFVEKRALKEESSSPAASPKRASMDDTASPAPSKRPSHTPFAHFCRQERLAAFRQLARETGERPDTKALARTLAAKWRQMSEEQRRPYEESALKAKDAG